MQPIVFSRTFLFLLLVLVLSLVSPPNVQANVADWSVARKWNEVLLHAIRNDFARPTVHARNLYHTSGATWDAWAAYDDNAIAVLHHESLQAADVEAAREEAISYAAYRILKWRFANSPGAEDTMQRIETMMSGLGYDPGVTSTTGNSPAALGNRIAQAYIDYGLNDYSNELGEYENLFYEPVNEPLIAELPGNPDISDPNRWQPLAFDIFIDQSGNPFPGFIPDFLSPEWGVVKPFALQGTDLTTYRRDGFDYLVYHDPGPPPLIGGVDDAGYKAGFEQVAIWSGQLDPADGVMIDISPASRGNNPLGTNDGNGHPLNPVTGQPYQKQIVPAGDYYRVLAEFWADGPDSETPPGHWFTIANYVSDHPLVVKRLGGQGPLLNNLEWDVKVYLALGGAMHDAAITAWGIKGWYDYIRPVSAIRYMCDRGQSSNPAGDSYHPNGINLHPGSIELITNATAAPGQRHHHIAGNSGQHIGKIALYAWRGPDFINDPETDVAGVGWIRCEDWWPYQRPSFITPPFAGYVSGHSTYSRAAAVVMTELTGDEFFPGGMGEFLAPRNQFLVFEDGPSVDLTLQWATYFDASDETSISRIYGGIHPPADDIPGRLMGAEIGADAMALALQHFGDPSYSGRATFAVSKSFNDGNPRQVEVRLSCNTGKPLDQKKLISAGSPVNFVVTDFEPGKLDCQVSEETLAGYDVQYAASADDPRLVEGSISSLEDGCRYTGVLDGAFSCGVSNSLLPVLVAVHKEWKDVSPTFNLPRDVKVELVCDKGNVVDPERYISPENPGMFTVFPHYSGSSCRVDEEEDAGFVGDLSDCTQIKLEPGVGDYCTVVNTRLYEGIPTLDYRGLALMALLMLAAGLIGFRRYL
jgi:hypothetical protein